MGSLSGKVAVVTGGGNGIGRAHSLLFAREGAKVVVNDIGLNRHGEAEAGLDPAAEVVKEIQALGGEAVANRDPVGSFENAEKIVGAAVEAFGRIDILINNAGILRDKTILKMSPQEWQAVLDVHLNGSFACLQAAARVMKDQATGGRIVNTSSSSGLLGNFGQANYGAAKAAIYALTRIAAWELGKYGITVNAIAPAALTRMTFDLPGIKDRWRPEEMSPDHISPIVAYLCTDEGGKITGQTFGVDGNHLFIYKMVTSHGLTKRGTFEPWKIEEIGPALERIISW